MKKQTKWTIASLAAVVVATGGGLALTIPAQAASTPTSITSVSDQTGTPDGETADDQGVEDGTNDGETADDAQN